MSDYFYNAIRRDIVMIKNDTMSFAFQVQGLGGQTPDNIVFTCKETPDKDTALFSVDLGNHITERSYDSEHDIRTYILRIPPELTENVEAGRYFYDIQFTVNRDILTLMKGRLTVEYQITGGSVEPEPDYENGDLVKYPLVGIPLGTIKLYTEQYISDIASWINTILVDPNGRYTTQEMSGALSDINDYLLALSAALKTALSDQSPDDIPLPEMPETMTVINGDISDINDAINAITGGSGNIPLSDMAGIISNSKKMPNFNEVLIADNTALSSTITFTQSWDNFDLIKIELTNNSNPSWKSYIYTTPSNINNIAALGGVLHLSRGTYNHEYYGINVNDLLFTRFAGGNTATITAVYGLNCINYTLSETVLYNSNTSDNSPSVEVESIESLYDYDIILITINDGNYTRCTPSYGVIIEPKMDFLKDHVVYNIESYSTSPNIILSEHKLSSANYMYVSGIKFL